MCRRTQVPLKRDVTLLRERGCMPRGFKIVIHATQCEARDRANPLKSSPFSPFRDTRPTFVTFTTPASDRERDSPFSAADIHPTGPGPPRNPTAASQRPAGSHQSSAGANATSPDGLIIGCVP